MRRIRIKSAAWLLCLLLAIMLPSFTVYADDSGACGDNLKWTLSDGTLTISGKGRMTDYDDDNMAPWYAQADTITRLVIDEGVVNTGRLAFYGCTSLTRASLPSTLIAVGVRSFKGCKALTYINLPDGLLSIGESAFEACRSLGSMTLPEGLQSMGDFAFYRCASLQSVTIPASVLNMGLVTFAYCTALTQASICCPIVKLPDWTFYGCTSLLTVALPDSVETVGEFAFHNCTSVNAIHYSGNAEATLSASLQTDQKGVSSAKIVHDQFDGVTTVVSGEEALDKASGTEQKTQVTETEKATITVKTETEYAYQIDGESATLGEVLTAVENDVPITTTQTPSGQKEPGGKEEPVKGITINTSSTTVISAVVRDDDGWSDVIDAVNRELESGSAKVAVDVQLPNSTVAGSDLSSLAGKDITLSLSTSSGDTWIVDESAQTEDSFSKETYDLNFTVTKLEKNDTKIDSDTVYTVKFEDSTDFEATVGINVKVGNAYQYATLYEKKGLSGLTQRQTVMVDADGNAWFQLQSVDKKAKYYVGINVNGVDTANAVIPASLYAEYGIDDEYTLTDSSGTQYEVGERTSAWGITGKQFIIYVAIGLGAIVLVVTLVMVTIHKISKSKQKYANLKAEAESADNAPIDEEALRLQVMQEMLEEAEKAKKQDTTQS